jgi:hypothetical protein
MNLATFDYQAPSTPSRLCFCTRYIPIVEAVLKARAAYWKVKKR